ncbi:hypothetical protein GWC95_10110 [Sediminibacterium roseum]|uniref:Uncharacterized protein n=1 Tax=Sediminibacterium roseum TaxID=1978412 RepID=A0ABW9ZT33_9BACT|nr:hypothetical protein [Sediminibacterium roseum]NCI50276.1 hypothetical protein [Sediminibacterium roseum]
MKRPNESVTVAFLSVESFMPRNRTVTPGSAVTESLLFTQPVSRRFCAWQNTVIISAIQSKKDLRGNITLE